MSTDTADGRCAKFLRIQQSIRRQWEEWATIVRQQWRDFRRLRATGLSDALERQGWMNAQRQRTALVKKAKLRKMQCFRRTREGHEKRVDRRDTHFQMLLWGVGTYERKAAVERRGQCSACLMAEEVSDGVELLATVAAGRLKGSGREKRQQWRKRTEGILATERNFSSCSLFASSSPLSPPLSI